MAAAQAVPMIDIPGYGTLAAEVVCTRLGIKNQHDSKKLAEAKAEVYLKGFTSGVMTVGNHKGVKVCCCTAVIGLLKGWHSPFH